MQINSISMTCVYVAQHVRTMMLAMLGLRRCERYNLLLVCVCVCAESLCWLVCLGVGVSVATMAE